jgi:hypothetical protein
MSDVQKAKDSAPKREEWEDIVRQQVNRLRFGVVQIVVHDGRVTQVDATEKTRLADKGGVAG